MAKYCVGQVVFFVDGKDVCEGTVDTVQTDSQGITYTLEDLLCRFAGSELFKTEREAKNYLEEVLE